MRKPTTGEPCAGKPLARFGGRGGESLPYPYHNVDGPHFERRAQLRRISGLAMKMKCRVASVAALVLSMAAASGAPARAQPEPPPRPAPSEPDDQKATLLDFQKAAFMTMPEADRKATQEALGWLGLYNGVVDGAYGKRTIDSLIARTRTMSSVLARAAASSFFCSELTLG